MAEIMSNKPSSFKFAPNSTQAQVVRAINLLAPNPGRFVREEKILAILGLMNKACTGGEDQSATNLSQEALSGILDFLTATGVLEMAWQEFPRFSQLCGCGGGCGSCCGAGCGSGCGGGCCGCGRYYRVKIGAL